MTPRRDFLLSAIAIALLAAIVALLASGAWERAAAEPSATNFPSPRADISALLPVVAVQSAQPVQSEPAPSGAVGSVLLGGTLSFVDAKYGPTYLALPFPRGTVAEICGPGGCVTRRSTDYGPDQRVHPNRIADLSAADFVYVCGLPLSAGLCRGTVEIDPPVDEADERMRAEDGGPAPTVPPTDTAP